MIKNQVLHIFRKLLPPTATFIYNQIAHHIKYEPHILYTEDIPGKLASGLVVIPSQKTDPENNGSWLYGKFRILTQGENHRGVRFVQELKPDIIHVHYGVDMLTYASILNRVNIPVVVSFYGYDYSNFPKRFMGLGKYWLQRSVFGNKNLKAVFAMSPDMAKNLISIGCPESLIRLHYYGSECSKFNMERKYLQRDPVRFTIISGLTEKKGHLVLLEAWIILGATTHKKIQLTIIGSGSQQEQIESFIGKNEIKNIFLKKKVVYGSPAHFNALANTDVFVHPSRTASDGDSEGIPGAIIESMASGLPVVSTWHAGIPSVLAHGSTGLLVEENNPGELAKAMAQLAEDPSLRERLGRNARDFALSELDIKTKELELEALYDEVIESC